MENSNERQKVNFNNSPFFIIKSIAFLVFYLPVQKFTRKECVFLKLADTLLI